MTHHSRILEFKNRSKQLQALNITHSTNTTMKIHTMNATITWAHATQGLERVDRHLNIHIYLQTLFPAQINLDP